VTASDVYVLFWVTCICNFAFTVGPTAP